MDKRRSQDFLPSLPKPTYFLFYFSLTFLWSLFSFLSSLPSLPPILPRSLSPFLLTFLPSSLSSSLPFFSFLHYLCEKARHRYYHGNIADVQQSNRRKWWSSVKKTSRAYRQPRVSPPSCTLTGFIHTANSPTCLTTSS